MKYLLFMVLALSSLGWAQSNKYCSGGNIPSFGASDGPAQLPRSCYYTALSATPSTGTIRTVTDVTSWNTQWAAAVCGDIIQIPEGTTIVAVPSTGLVIPTKTCDATHYITVRTSGFASLPAEGTRLTPCSAGVASLPGRPAYPCPAPANHMAKLVSGTAVGQTTNAAVKLSANSAYIRFIGIEFTRSLGAGPAATGNNSLIFDMSSGGSHHIIFDRVWAHGDASDETGRFTTLAHNSFVAVIDGYYNDFYCISGGTCTDAQAINLGTNGTAGQLDNTYKIVNNFLEAAGQSVLAGGGAGVIVPTDIEVRQNYMFKPQTWNPSSPTYAPIRGTFTCVKNNFELKNGSRVLLEGNVIEGSWAGCTQKGNAVTLTPTTQNGGCIPCQVTNVTVRYNHITWVAQPFQLAMVIGTSGPPAQAGNNFSIHDNLADNLYYATCNNCSGSATLVQMINLITNPINAVFHDVRFDHNTFVVANPSSAQPSGLLGLSSATIASGLNQSNITFTNNIGVRGTQGTSNSIGGTATNCAFGQSFGANMINACWSPKTFGGNTIVQSIVTAWPGTNCLSLTSQSTSLYVSYNGGLGGDYHVSASSPCHNTGTDGKDPGANIDLVAAAIAGVGASPPPVGPLPPTNLTVTVN